MNNIQVLNQNLNCSSSGKFVHFVLLSISPEMFDNCMNKECLKCAGDMIDRNLYIFRYRLFDVVQNRIQIPYIQECSDSIQSLLCMISYNVKCTIVHTLNGNCFLCPDVCFTQIHNSIRIPLQNDSDYL